MGRKSLNVYLLVFVVLLVWGMVGFGIHAATDKGYESYSRRSYRPYGIQKVWDNVRVAAALTTSYVNTNSFLAEGYTGVGLLFKITRGSLTSFEYKVWWSIDGNTWYQEATETVAVGVIADAACYYRMTLSGNVNYFKVVPCYAKWVRLQVKGTGTVTGSSCEVKVIGVE